MTAILSRSPAQALVNVLVETVDARSGRVLSRDWRHNLVVDAGLNKLRDLLFGDQLAGITHGAVGTLVTAPAAADVALGAEVFRDVLAQRLKVSKALTLKLVLGSQQGNGNTLREAGLFDAAAGGTMYARVTPAEVIKTDAILVIYTWTASFQAAA